MGYRGKVAEREEARRLRAQSWTLPDIARWLSVSKSSVSIWVRDVDFEPSPRRTGARTRPNALRERRLAEIERLNAEGIARVGELSEREFLMAGIALYAGEGGKTDGEISFPNSDPRMIDFFAGGSATSSILMRRAFGCGCISTRGWTSTPPRSSGRSSLRSR